MLPGSVVLLEGGNDSSIKWLDPGGGVGRQELDGDVLQLCQRLLRCTMAREIVQEKQYMSARSLPNIGVQGGEPGMEKLS